MASDRIPYMLLEGKGLDRKHKVYLDLKDQTIELPEDWVGVCREVTGTVPFWYLGRDANFDDRSFVALSARNYEAALSEGGKYAAHERLMGNRSSVGMVVAAIGLATNDNVIPLMDSFGQIKVCTEFDAIQNFAVQADMTVLHKQAVHQLFSGWCDIQALNAINPVSQEDFKAYQDRRDAASKVFASELEAVPNLKELSGIAPNGLKIALARDASAESGWVIKRYRDGSPFSTDGVSSLTDSVQGFINEVRGTDLRINSVDWMRSDASFLDADTGVMFLIADCIEVGRELPTLMRELCKHRAERVLDATTKTQLVDQLESWALCHSDSKEFKVYSKAYQRSSAVYGSESYQNHLFAYAVEEAAAMGIKPSVKAAPESVEQWLGELESAIKRVFDHASMLTDSLDMQDLVDMSYVLNAMDHPTMGYEVRQLVSDWRNESQQLSELVGRTLFGYYPEVGGNDSFQGEVVDASGKTVFVVRSGDSLPEGESSLVEQGYMSDFYDVKGLQSYLLEQGHISEEDRVLPLEEMQLAVDRLKAGLEFVPEVELEPTL